MEQSKIDRINELYRKSKAEGLTEAEKKEQTLLRPKAKSVNLYFSPMNSAK